jgi:hypothetical protein
VVTIAELDTGEAGGGERDRELDRFKPEACHDNESSITRAARDIGPIRS